MGSICSKRAAEEDVNINKNERQIEVDKSSVQLVAPTIFIKEGILVDVLGRKDAGNVIVSLEEGDKKTKLVDEKKKGRHESVAMDSESIDDQPRMMIRMISMRRPSAAREAWPQWLTAAAGEAVEGWLPRRADSFEKLDKIKCYMQQLLRGLEHCHKHGVLHRDIKGSNLLINNDGVLKIADFGLATSYQLDQSLPLTSRVVTLWYRAPELLLGATEYGPAIDMWSAGCILAELFTGKHIMPGRTEVEQMHKIFKLCGSPSEAYWTKTKFPHATSFKPQQPYIRRIAETFKNFPPSALTLVDKLLSMEPQDRGSATSALRSEFFRIEPLPSDPSSLPKYPPSKELDAKMRDEEARRQKAEAVKGRGPESVRRGSGDTKKAPTSEFTAQGQPKTICSSYKYNIQEDGGSSFRIEPPRVSKKNGLEHSASVIHHSAVGLSLNKSVDCTENNPELRSKKSHVSQSGEISSSSLKKKERVPSMDSSAGFVPRKTRIHYSGPLMPPGGNMEEILEEHERQIQQAVRKARLEKSGTKDNLDSYEQLHHNR
ncbi:hypothetical protein D5086_019673 [Populus alba]|uniref:Uncharacterized protein n=1 Tax=Populus alba TaxID=43335 RepID=A0ACC4BJC8_POPAL